MVVEVNVKNPAELRIMQQSVGLLYHTKSEIGFFKIIKAPIPKESGMKEGEKSEERFKTLKTRSVCFSNFYDVD